mgnify:FL=1
MTTNLKNNLIIKNLYLKHFLQDGSCEAEYLGNKLRVFGGIEEEIVDVEVIGKDIDLICNVVNIVKHSSYRIKNKCIYFLECSGCQLQHINYEKQLEIKKQFVVKELEEIDENILKKIHNVVPSDKQFNYRNHARFSVSKSKKYLGNSGFINRWTKKLVNIEKCEIMNQKINDKKRQLKGHLEGMSQYSVRVSVKGDSFLIQPKFNDLNIITGQKNYYEKFKNKKIQISSPSFFQVNIEQAEKMGEIITEICSLHGNEIILDAFSGVGTFSLLLSEKVKKIYAIESSYSSVEDAKINLDNSKNVELIQNEVENLKEYKFKENIDIVILDPSRKGVHFNALNWVLNLSPSQIIYVSCNVSSLKKDIRILGTSYEIDKIIPLDMFPQTKHVECIVNLIKVKN